MKSKQTTNSRISLIGAITMTGAAALVFGGQSFKLKAVTGMSDGDSSLEAWVPDHSACMHTPELACCAMPGTPNRLLARINEYMWQSWIDTHPGEGGVAYFITNRWTPGAQGDPITLRWSVVPDGLFIPGGIGEPGGTSILRARLTQIFGTLDAGLQRMRDTYAEWTAVTGINFVEVSDDGAVWGALGSAARGDIRVGMHNFGFGGVLAYSSFPNAGDTVFNGSIDFDVPAGNYRFFRNVLCHETGHGTGLLHSCPVNATKLMEPLLSTVFDGPQHDDIRANQRNYGDKKEPNNGTSQATDLGSAASVDVNGLSLDDDSDVDYFKFTVADPNKMVTIRALPVGYIYPMAPQSPDGSCPAGTDINSIAVMNLAIRLIDSSLTTLFDDDSSSIGFTESTIDYHLPGPGMYYIRVGTTTVSNDVQMYDLQLRVNDIPGTACPADLDGNHSVNGLDLATLLAQWTGAASYVPCPPFKPADFNQDCMINGLDIASLLAVWGACP